MTEQNDRQALHLGWLASAPLLFREVLREAERPVPMEKTRGELVVAAQPHSSASQHRHRVKWHLAQDPFSNWNWLNIFVLFFL